jgi:N-acetylneuraminic acid mutarotase
MYMFGGFEVSVYMNDFFVLDLDTHHWKRVYPNQATSCPMPNPRAMSSLTLVGAKLVLFGGIYCSSDTTCTELNDVYHYDLLRNDLLAMEPKEPQPPARYGHTATLAGSELLIFGGASWPILLNDVFRYDVYDNQFSLPAGYPPYARKQHSLDVVTLNERPTLVVFGGKHGGGAMSNHVHLFDVETSAWHHPKAMGTQPPPTAHHATAVKDNSTLVVFGGYDGQSSNNNLYVGRWVSDTYVWEKVDADGTLPPAAHGHTVVTSTGAGAWLQFGGVDCLPGNNDTCTFFNKLYALNEETLAWSEVPVSGMPPRPRASHTMTTIGNTHYLYGGIGQSFTNFGDMYKLDDKSLSWSPVHIEAGTSLPPRFGHVAVNYKGELLVFGGALCTALNDCTYYNDVNIFSPKTSTWRQFKVERDAPAARIAATAAMVGETVYVHGGAAQDRIFGELVTIEPDQSVAEQSVVYGPGVATGVAGRNVRLFVQARDSFGANRTLGGDKIEVTVRPLTRLTVAKLDGCSIDVDVTDEGRGLYTAQYSVTIADRYLVAVSLNGQLIRNFTTELVADIADPAVSTLAGGGLTQCIAGQACKINVTLTDVHGNRVLVRTPLDVQFDGPHPVRKSVDFTDRHVITYTPTKVGVYVARVRVRLLDVAGSPFNVTVKHGVADPEHCKVEGSGVAKAVAGDLAFVTLDLFDAHDNRVLKGGHDVTLRLKGPDELVGSVVDYENGTFAVSYTAMKIGTYEMTVLLAGTPVAGCPFVIDVGNARMSPALTFAHGTAVRYAVAGYRSFFTIQGVDEMGNNMTTGGAKLSVMYVGPGDVKANTTVKDKGNGQYEVSYMSTVAGDFLISAALWSSEGGYQTIHDSPFLGTLVAAGADPLKSYMYMKTPEEPTGPTNLRVVMGVHNYFHIQAVDRYGNRKTQGGDKFAAEIEGPVTHDAFVSDSEDGTYIGTFVAPAAGKYLLRVFYGNVALSHTPIPVIARASFDECPEACHQRGECVHNECHCFIGYDGPDCSIELNKCPGNCLGNGICLNNTCLCYPGFSGPTCAIAVTKCPNDCSNHGVCKNGACKCDEGFKGGDCSDNAGQCPDRCMGNGECVQGECMCYPGFGGDNCAARVKFCPRGCSGNGKCLNSGQCKCSNGWGGPDCAQSLSQIGSSASLQSDLPAKLSRKH